MLSFSEFSFSNGTIFNNTAANYKDAADEKLTPLWTVVSMTLVYAVILITGVTGNVCTCVVIARNKYMHTATNYYLFSLAVSDLTLLLLGLPQELFQLWKPHPYIFGEVFCIFRGLTSETSTNASILTITCFTMERYLAICHPLRAHALSKLTRVIRIIIAVWMLSSLGALPVALQLGIVHEIRDGVIVPETVDCVIKRPLDHTFEASTLFFFVLPMILISVLYVVIGVQLRKTSSPVSGRSFVPSSAANTERSRTTTFSYPLLQKERHQVPSSPSASRRAVVKMLVAVVVAFFLCWAPFHAQRLMAIHVQNPTEADRIVYTVLTYISGVTYYLSATINPILYSIMSLKFRQAFKDTLAHCCSSANRRRPMRFTYSSHPNSTIRSTAGYDGTDLSVLSDSPRHRTDSCTSRRGGRPAPIQNGKSLIVSKREMDVSQSSKKGLLINGKFSTRSQSHNNDEISVTDEVSKHGGKSSV